MLILLDFACEEIFLLMGHLWEKNVLHLWGHVTLIYLLNGSASVNVYRLLFLWLDRFYLYIRTHSLDLCIALFLMTCLLISCIGVLVFPFVIVEWLEPITALYATKHYQAFIILSWEYLVNYLMREMSYWNVIWCCSRFLQLYLL